MTFIADHQRAYPWDQGHLRIGRRRQHARMWTGPMAWTRHVDLRDIHVQESGLRRPRRSVRGRWGTMPLEVGDRPDAPKPIFTGDPMLVSNLPPPTPMQASAVEAAYWTPPQPRVVSSGPVLAGMGLSVSEMIGSAAAKIGSAVKKAAAESGAGPGSPAWQKIMDAAVQVATAVMAAKTAREQRRIMERQMAALQAAGVPAGTADSLLSDVQSAAAGAAPVRAGFDWGTALAAGAIVLGLGLILRGAIAGRRS